MPNDIDALRAALVAGAGGVATALLGGRNLKVSSRSDWRWGSNGSLSVAVEGPNKGRWYNFEEGAGGDLIHLIQDTLSCNFPEALAWACSHTGVAVGHGASAARARPKSRSPEQQARTVAEAARAKAEDANRIAHARRLADKCVQVAGSPAEIYLAKTRGIPVPANGWPQAIRWHPKHRALVVVATVADGSVHAVQRVHLTSSGEKIGTAEQEARRVAAVKMTLGATAGAVVRLPRCSDGPLLIAEGPETGLAVYTATGNETWIALGPMARMELPTDRRVVVVSDDDPPPHDARHGQAAKALERAAQAWRERGVDLAIATPWPERRHDRSDMADVMLHHGPAAVAQRVAEAMQPTRSLINRVELTEGHRIVAAAVATMFGRIDDGSADLVARRAKDRTARPMPSFTQGVRVEVGVGKSHAAREHIATTLIAMRARGDMRVIVLALPTHALLDEQAKRFSELPIVQKAGLSVAIWRGREAKDPTHPDYRHADPTRVAEATMCGDLTAVGEARSISVSIQASCCRRQRRAGGKLIPVGECSMFKACSYQAQLEHSADLWIVPSDLLWHEKPSAIGEIAAVVVDEGVWRKGLQGVDGREPTLSLDEIEGQIGIANDPTAAARLQRFRQQVGQALRDLPDGPIRRDALLAAVNANGVRLITAEMASEALKLEWLRKVDTLVPGQNRAQRRAALVAAAGNKTISRFVMFWDALRTLLRPDGPEGSGWIALSTTSSGTRAVQLKGRRDIAAGWDAPTLLLDALLPVELAKFVWRDIELVADVRVQAPFQRVWQVEKGAFSLSMLEPLVGDAAAANPKEAQRRANRLGDLRSFLVRKAREYAPGRVLVVLQKRVKEALQALGSLPASLELAHHNSVAGRDEWRDVAALIVVGRTQPPPSSVERVAEALTGQAVRRLDGWYPRVEAVREMVDGTTRQAEAERHPDPLVEAIRWQSCEGELIQIVGRGRGVNRTTGNPVDVFLLTDVPLPIPLAGTLSREELEPGPADRMLAAGGVVLGRPDHAVAAYPFLWKKPAAAKKAFQRAKLGTFPYKESSIGECPQLRRLDYKVPGQERSVAGFDPSLCSDPEGFLRERLGQLSWCQIEAAQGSDPC